jgi:hypothetical protein
VTNGPAPTRKYFCLEVHICHELDNLEVPTQLKIRREIFNSVEYFDYEKVPSEIVKIRHFLKNFEKSPFGKTTN